MEQSQCRHFPSRAREGAEAVVMPARDHDHIRCFTNHVKLTRALVQDLDEDVKEASLLGEHDEKSSQKITKLEALCKRLREDAQKLKEEKTTLKGMIDDDELIMEMVVEYGLNHMGENDDDEDDDDEGNTVTPLAPTAMLEEIIEEEAPVEMVPEKEAPVAHEVILPDAEPEPPQPTSST
jgi:hypothetical protein